MIYTAVCDDSKEICSLLEKYIINFSLSCGEEIRIDKFYTAEDFLSALKNGTKYNIVFMDIELGGQSGISAAHEIRETLDNHFTQIAFITGQNKYMKQLFKVQPIDYLEKPVTQEDVNGVMKLIVRRYEKADYMFKYKKGRSNLCFEPISDILYFESDARMINIVTTHGTDSFYGNIADIEKELMNRGFFSPHKSYLVNYHQIRSFLVSSIIMNNKDVIPISKANKKSVNEYQIKLAKGEIS